MTPRNVTTKRDHKKRNRKTMPKNRDRKNDSTNDTDIETDDKKRRVRVTDIKQRTSSTILRFLQRGRDRPARVTISGPLLSLSRAGRGNKTDGVWVSFDRFFDVSCFLATVHVVPFTGV